MAGKFTKEEVAELVKIARVYAPGLTDERFRALVESETELADSAFFEAAWALARIAGEQGVSPIQAIDRYQELTKELRTLELAVSQQRQLMGVLEGNVYKARRELADAIGKQKDVQKAKAQEEAALLAFRKAASQEKQAISAQLALAKEQAQVTEQDVAAAGALKAQLQRRGLDLGLVLDLCQEIPDGEEAKGRLAAAIERHGSLAADTDCMEKRLEETNASLATADKEFKDRRKALDDLRADEAQQAELRRFYQRFCKLEQLMDYLVTWEEIGLRRCKSCGARFWAEVKRPTGLFYIQRDYYVCPRCGALWENFDEAAHRAAGLDLNPKARLKFIKEG